MTFSNVVASFAIILSSISLIIAFLNFRKDKGRFEVSASIVSSKDESFIKIHVSNIGLRPITIKDFGYIDWEFGMFCIPLGIEGDFNKTLKEAESIDIKLPLGEKTNPSKIRRLLIRDHSNKKWFATDSSMMRIYRYVYGHDSSFASDKTHLSWDDLARGRNKSLVEYLKFIKKYKVENKLIDKLAHPHDSIKGEIIKKFETSTK